VGESLHLCVEKILIATDNKSNVRATSRTQAGVM